MSEVNTSDSAILLNGVDIKADLYENADVVVKNFRPDQVTCSNVKKQTLCCPLIYPRITVNLG